MRKLVSIALLINILLFQLIHAQQIIPKNARIDLPPDEENLNVFQQWIKWNNPGSLLINHLIKQAFDLYEIRDIEISKLKTRNDWIARQKKVKLIPLNQSEIRFTPLPEGQGISAGYPGDKGISEDPDVVFHENFEEFKGNNISKTEMGGWDHFYNDLVITRNSVNVNMGKQALEVTHRHVPQAHGAVKEVAGYDTLFLRFYMKFHPEFPGVHHAGMYVRGGQPGALLDNPTGTRPTGKDHFTATVDHLFPTHGASPPENKIPPGFIYNYCYHMDQKDIYGDILLPSGIADGSDLLGHDFIPRPNKNPERNRWYCFEIMIQCNDPGYRNGRVAIWVDGVLLADHPNLRFRTVESVKARYVTLSTYTSRKEENNILWYDDIVVAKKYIGPISGKAN